VASEPVVKPTVVVLAGGPDREREVSKLSAATIAQGLRDAGRFEVRLCEIGALDGAGLAALAGDVIFPALHGPWGEGGTIQRLLEADGRPYVGAGPAASRGAIDKVFTKSVAAGLGLTVLPTAILRAEEPMVPFAFPVVAKPVFEGSTIGLHVCRDAAGWGSAHASAAATGIPYMVEPMVKGREMTVGVVDRGGGFEALPVIEIRPAEGLYDYEAKYTREDTRYLIDPELPPGVARRMQVQTLALARAMGLRDLCRADFLLDDQHRAVFLEVNTMPGFTSHSLVPMAAAHVGISVAELVSAFVDNAMARREVR
jgi:D-alanine-D-alanine ligase